MGLGLRFRFLLPWLLAWAGLTAYYFLVWAPDYVQTRRDGREDAFLQVVDGAGEVAAVALREGRTTEAQLALDRVIGRFGNILMLRLEDGAGRSVQSVGGDRQPPDSDAVRTYRRELEKVGKGAVMTARVDYSPTVLAATGEIQRLYVILFTTAAGVTLLTGLIVERLLRRPIAELAEAADALANRRFEFGISIGKWGYGKQLADSLRKVRDLLKEQQGIINEEVRARKLAEERARESDERLHLTTAGSDSGLWEWDLGNDTAYFSPRWKSMLGYRLDEVGSTIEEWSGRIHPEEAAEVDRTLRAHLEGQSPVFDSEHRARRADGEYLWVRCRGMAVRSASGRPIRVVGMMSDIHASKRTADMLAALSAGLATARGPAFFRQLVKSLAEVFNVPCAFITECADQGVTQVRTLAFWNGGSFMDDEEYDLAGRPCDLVINMGRIEFHPSGLADRYPKEAGFESYLGMPVVDSAGAVVGHIACLGTQPMPADLPIDPIFRLYSVRAGLELERRRVAVV